MICQVGLISKLLEYHLLWDMKEHFLILDDHLLFRTYYLHGYFFQAQIYKVPYEFLVNDTKKIDIENLLGYKEELVINSKKGAEILLKTLKNFNSYSKKTQNLIEEFLERVLYFEEKNNLDNALNQTKKIINYIST